MDAMEDIGDKSPNPFDTLRDSGHSFIALPAEIRTRVYHELMSWPFAVNLTYYRGENGPRLRLSRCPFTAGMKIAAKQYKEARRVGAFILSHKTIYNEAIEMLYSKMAIKGPISLLGSQHLTRSSQGLVANVRHFSQPRRPSSSLSPQGEIRDILQTLPTLEIFSFGVDLLGKNPQSEWIDDMALSVIVSMIKAQGSALTKAFVHMMRPGGHFRGNGIVTIIADTVDDQCIPGIEPGPRMWVDLNTGIASLPPAET